MQPTYLTILCGQRAARLGGQIGGPQMFCRFRRLLYSQPHRVRSKWVKIQKCQPSYKCVHFCTQFLVGFKTNYCISAVWYGGDQPMALLRCSTMVTNTLLAFRSTIFRLLSS